ncbi:hypothetical protein G5B31_10550 [Rhodobacter sp. SGA-6-6]|uniref:hypothetical protein n=1 Tax=Rhodobacter sp. SGA-6-6 TaxID=2710882 RepID=UPI0013E9A109|nr:hypothetical protein [Rhodobacter sp. SGA-6-6]NGM45981.1 hypothetical protein [Rhodobacter sp. SGA-6-6]
MPPRAATLFPVGAQRPPEGGGHYRIARIVRLSYQRGGFSGGSEAMVEIFTVAGGPGGASARSVTNDVRLAAPSDVYFGSGAAGIAYYEKSGADLRVILLDGQEVLVRDFFVIGPAGEYSRLLDGGAGGEVEITGLLAPEPFVPPTEPAAVAEAEKAEEAQPMADADNDSPQGEEIVVGPSDGEPAPDDAAPVAGGGGGGVMTIAGIGLDRLLFAAAAIPVSVELLDDDDDKPPAPAALPAQESVDAEGSAEDAGTEPAPGAAAGDAGPQGAGEGELGALIAGLLQGDGLLGGLLGAEGPGDVLADDSASPFLDALFVPPVTV